MFGYDSIHDYFQDGGEIHGTLGYPPGYNRDGLQHLRDLQGGLDGLRDLQYNGIVNSMSNLRGVMFGEGFVMGRTPTSTEWEMYDEYSR